MLGSQILFSQILDYFVETVDFTTVNFGSVFYEYTGIHLVCILN